MSIFKLTQLAFFTTVFCGHQVFGLPHYTMEIERNEPIMGDEKTLADFSNVRTIRTKDRERCLNGTFTLSDEIDESFKVSIRVAVSVTGDSRFVELPTQFNHPQSLCDTAKQHYGKFLQPSFKKHIVNLPLVSENGWCHVPKGIYHVACMRSVINNDFPDHMRHGFYKVSLIIYKNDVIMGGITVFARVNPKME